MGACLLPGVAVVELIAVAGDPASEVAGRVCSVLMIAVLARLTRFPALAGGSGFVRSTTFARASLRTAVA
ncbi:MAG: hypothetical protein ACK5YO_32050, partial [Planctomyces sp.]